MARNRLVWLLSLAILSVLPAGATFQTFTTLAEWQAHATQAGVTINFSTFAPNLGNFMYTRSLYVEPVTFTSPPDLNIQVIYSSKLEYQWDTAQAILCAYAGHPLKVTLTTPVTAFAARMGIYNGGTGSQMCVKVHRSGTEVFPRTLPTFAHPTLTFFGVVSTHGSKPFNSITFTPPGCTRAFLDDVRLGDTPEMGTGLLSLCGGILLAAAGFRKRGKPL